MTGIRTTNRAHEPRKRPTQARARATVEAIVEAAAQVFEQSGYSATTTDLVAERAGVSIGTLYQYFPSKDALLVALFERHLEEVEASFDGLAERLALDPTVETAARDTVSAVFALNGTTPGLHRVLFEEAPIPERLLAYYAGVAERLKAAWTRYLEDRVRDPTLVALMTITLLEAMGHRLKIYPPAERSPAELEAATVDMLVAYVRAG